jgi:Piezo non-specific cation channel, R-Ras-binding domain
MTFHRFMIIPFLFELRTVLDWIFVKTSLTFFEWVRVESIYAQGDKHLIFETLNCQR